MYPQGPRNPKNRDGLEYRINDLPQIRYNQKNLTLFKIPIVCFYISMLLERWKFILLVTPWNDCVLTGVSR